VQVVLTQVKLTCFKAKLFITASKVFVKDLSSIQHSNTLEITEPSDANLLLYFAMTYSKYVYKSKSTINL